MEKEVNNLYKREKNSSLETDIESVAEKFLEKTKNTDIKIISHFDTDGITSASIMIQALKKLDKKFSLEIIKSLDQKFISNLPRNKPIVFLDLASGSLEYIKEFGLENVFIIDHHEITQDIPENVYIINPQLNEKEKISSAGLVYLFCKQLNSENIKYAKLAVLGMIGDIMEEGIEKLKEEVSNDGEIQKRKGLLIYPSTRPLNKALEYSSEPYIPNVTGNMEGVLELLREANLTPKEGKYKTLIELNEEEMSRLVTSIMLRSPKARNKQIVGNIFLIKFFNHLADARELSAIINACSRLGKSEIALQFCLESPKAKEKAESMYIKYKQLIISGLKFASETDKIEGDGFVIINAQDQIKDTMIGIIASILSNSPVYELGTVIIAMALDETGDKIKVSARNVGSEGKNVREILAKVIEKIGGEVGGHEFAAGCIISSEKEQEFIKTLKKDFEIELVRIE